jgi:hypothetical protein
VGASPHEVERDLVAREQHDRGESAPGRGAERDAQGRLDRAERGLGIEESEPVEAEEDAAAAAEEDAPRTKKGPLTAPKFGSAGSGGAELDPGPEGGTRRA